MIAAAVVKGYFVITCGYKVDNYFRLLQRAGASYNIRKTKRGNGNGIYNFK